MGTEMARRLKVRVLCVVALAGASADGFGEARLARNVWVVPVSQLAAWLATRAVVAPDEAQRLGVLVRTEFPSTTTDWRLLAAIGHDLDRRDVSVRAHDRPPRRVSRPLPSAPVSSPSRSRQRPKRRRTRGWLRPVAFLVGAGVLMWSLQTGAVWKAAAGVGSALAGRVAESDSGRAGGPEAEGLACADFNPRTVKQLRQLDLTGQGSPYTCRYRATVAGNAQTVLSITEAHAYYPMTTQLAKSMKARGPVITTSSGPSGKVTLLQVAEGVTLKLGKTTVPASRDVEVYLAHEALGLTAKQGRQLATQIAMKILPSQPDPSNTAAG